RKVSEEKEEPRGRRESTDSYRGRRSNSDCFPPITANKVAGTLIMDNPERFDQTNQGSSSSIPSKRKRGRPRSDEVQQLNPPVTAIDENLIGQMVSGVVEGSFEAGYFLNVKVADTDKQFKGIVFLPGKVTPVTPTTDLFPQAKMYAREVPSLNQQTPTTQSKRDAGNQTDFHPMSDEGVGSEAIDTEMKDVGGSSAEDKLTEPEGQTLSLMPQFASDDAPKDDHTVLRSEACGATLETNPTQATGSSSTLSLDLFQNETKRSGLTEDEESPKDAETRGMEGKTVSLVDDVPEELQLELGNKKMSATSNAAETNPDQATSSKGGLLANLFESREETAKGPEETYAGSGSGATTTTQVDDNDS
uniref:AT hook motif-containing protein n=2 Tax=Brassica oleracea var. oleracea TaxID=109376 RepID=A0A0D3EAH2_BRAOL